MNHCFHFKRIIHVIFCFILVDLSGQLQAQQLERNKFDVCVYGATPSGIAAAVSASEYGSNVVLIEPTAHVGGMMTGGMSNPDFKTFEALGGFYLNFMKRVENFYAETYGEGSQQVNDCFHGVWYEPKVAGRIFDQLITESNIVLIKEEVLDQVKVNESGLLRSIITTKPGGSRRTEFEAAAFIDATYEGDLMAIAGCDYNVGRESREEYGELYAGEKYYDNGKFLIGSSGKGDHKVQCYNFRLCMTDDPSNRVPIRKPENYSRKEFISLLDLMEEGKITKFINELVAINRIPNQKADINDKMYSLYSLRLPGENYEWPDGDAEVRNEIFERHKSYTLSFLYFLQNDHEVPETIRDEAREWGLAKDEFTENDNFPPVLYIREARRLKGDFILTEADLQPVSGTVRAPIHQDAVAICDYSMDSHGNAPPSPMHPGITEGVFNAYVVPYQIPYATMVPKGIDGLLVTCAVSSSHVAFSSLRMEPTWCALGQAAGISAAMAVKDKQMVRGINIENLQGRIHESKGMTVYISDVSPDSPYFEAAQFWGTKGVFHHLPEFEDVPHIGRGAKGDLPGQFILKYPYHDVSPDMPIAETLAQKWCEMAEIRIGDLQWTDGETTRGDFLIKMYNHTKKVSR